MFLYDDSDIYQPSILDEDDLVIFLSGYKAELLRYLEEKFRSISHCPPTGKIYNELTLEVINIIKLLLQFGLFDRIQSQETRSEHRGSRQITGFQERKSVMGLSTSHQNDHLKDKSDIEKLVNYLAALLEYDESYFSCLSNYKLTRKYHEIRESKEL